MDNWKIVLVVMVCVCNAGFAATGKSSAPAPSTFNVRDYGAKGDGISMDSPAINQAIAAAAEKGGGTVLFPSGIYLSASIHLKSHITLLLDAGAVIMAADYAPGSGYDEPETALNDTWQDFGHSHFHNSLIWGEHLTDIGITGTGMINGRGLVRNNGKGDKTPNKSISLKLCRNVLIRDITIVHGGWFGILATGVDNLTIDNIKEDTNRDGMDLDCCQYVTVSNCKVNSPLDDGICLKSSFALNRPCSTENVTITNCIVSGYEEGSFLDGTYKRTPLTNHLDLDPTGRIKFGTESNGGFKNITISNCVFDYCRGLAIETTDGAVIEDIAISDITMRDVINSPIYLRIGARMRGPAGAVPGVLRRIMISNLVVYNADPRFSSIISGIAGHKIEDIHLHDIVIYTKGGGTAEQARIIMPEVDKEYPEPERHGITSAYGFYIHYADQVDLHNIKIVAETADLRPAFVLDNVHGIAINQLRIVNPAPSANFSMRQVNDFSISQSSPTQDIKLNNTDHKIF